MPGSPPNPLITELGHWHDVTRLRYQQFLEAITALNLAEAERHLTLYANMVLATTEFSADQLRQLEHNDKASQTVVKADHQILRRTLELVQTGLAELIQLSQEHKERLRSALVERLDIFVRMQNILVNHQQRLQLTLLDLLDKSVNPVQSQQLADRLTEVMHQAQPS